MNSTKVLQLRDSYIFSTSGTSAAPRRVERIRAEIEREIKYLADTWPARRILSVVPMRHIYGYLCTVLLGNFLSVTVMNIRGWSTESVQACLRSGDLIVAYPGAWLRWTELKWPAGICGVSSGGGLQEGLVDQLLRNGLARWSEIYGCTELGAVGIREGLDLNFALVPYWPDRLAGIEAPDELHWRDERHFALGRRLDGLVEISGMLVDFARLRALWLQLEGVREVVLRKQDGRIEAMVAGSVKAGELQQFLEGRMAPWERPRRLWICDQIPLDELGKPLFHLETSIDI